MRHPNKLAIGLLLGTPLLAHGGSQDRTSPVPEPTPTSSAPSDLAWSDWNGDGRNDAAAVLPDGSVVLLENRGDGTFEERGSTLPATLPAWVVQAAWADYDVDGRPDLLLLSGEGTLFLARNAGEVFEDATPTSLLDPELRAEAVAWNDYDGNGLPDIVVRSASGYGLLYNAGAEVFEPVELPTAPVAIGGGIVSPSERPATPPDERSEGDATTVDRSRVSRAGPARAALGRGIGPGTSGAFNPTGDMGHYAVCAVGISDQSSSDCLTAASVPTLGSLYPMSDAWNVGTTGRLGAGTTAPLTNMHLAFASLGIDDTVLFGEKLLVEHSDSVVGLYSSGGGSYGSGLVLAETAFGAIVDKWTMIRETSALGSTLRFTFGSNVAWNQNPTRVAFDGDGDVGIGTASPAADLHVVSSDNDRALLIDDSHTTSILPAAEIRSSREMTLRLSNSNATNRAAEIEGNVVIGSDFVGFVPKVILNPNHCDGGRVDVRNQTGGKGVEIYGGECGENGGLIALFREDGTETITIDADRLGKGRITTQELAITGGADLVEGFEASDGTPSPGTVMVIDEANPGELRTSRAAYDRRVAGVVSGAGGIDPGLRMGQEGVASGDTLVALTGRVWVKACAESGPVRPGDLLTTASRPGHAMRASDTERSFGAVIGKAMSSLDEGTGLVLVLVNLQ